MKKALTLLACCCSITLSAYGCARQGGLVTETAELSEIEAYQAREAEEQKALETEMKDVDKATRTKR